MDNLSLLDWEEFLSEASQYATSETTKDQVRATGPLASAAEAKCHQRDVLEARNLFIGDARVSVGSLDLYEPWAIRLKKSATLTVGELRDVRSFCLDSLILTEMLMSREGESGPWVAELLVNFQKTDEPLSAIDSLITPNGEIRNDASELLYRLTREKDQLAKEIQSKLEKLVGAHELRESLQDRFVTTREGRWVIPIRSSAQHNLEGTIQARSITRQTVFIEPAVIVPLNNRLRQVELEIDEEIERLLVQISHYLHSQQTRFEQCRLKMIEYDRKMAFGQQALLVESNECDFREGFIELEGCYNPILKVRLGSSPVVRNTIRLSQTGHRVLLLSGPNAGGKTILLKTIGMAAQMARCGLPICCRPGAAIGFFESIQVIMGDSQSLGGQLSTFAGHLLALQKASDLKGNGSLVLIDEICGSTDPEEGSAIARAFIEEFINNGVFAVVTSHLGPLKSGWEKSPTILPGSMEFDSTKSLPTFRFISGMPGESLALQMAKRAGVRPHILAKAEEFLAPQTRARLSRLEELALVRRELEVARDHHLAEQDRIQRERKDLQLLKANLQNKLDHELARVEKQLRARIEESLAAAQIQKVFKKHEDLAAIQKTLPQVIKASRNDIRNAAQIQGSHFEPSLVRSIDAVSETSEDVEFVAVSAEAFRKRFPAGSRIYISSIQQDGVLQGEPNDRGEVSVLSGSLRLTLPWSELLPPRSSKGGNRDLARRLLPSVPLAQDERSIDLRGKTAEEALAQLDSQLDLAMRAQEDRIRIIHGNGTAALKKAVRVYLSRSKYVKRWTAEGATDGATIVVLSDE